MVVPGFFDDLAVVESDLTLALFGNERVVGDDHEGRAVLVELVEQAEDDLLVGFVQVAGGFVGQQQLGVVDEGAGHAHALLLAAGELARQVGGAVGEADAVEGLEGFLLVGHRVVVLGNHDVLEGGEVADEVELLEDEADGTAAHLGEFVGGEVGDVVPVEHDGALGSGVHGTDDVHEGGLAGAGGADDGDPLAARDFQRDVVQGVQVAVDLGDALQGEQRVRRGRGRGGLGHVGSGGGGVGGGHGGSHSPRRTSAGSTASARRTGGRQARTAMRIEHATVPSRITGCREMVRWNTEVEMRTARP